MRYSKVQILKEFQTRGGEHVNDDKNCKLNRKADSEHNNWDWDDSKYNSSKHHINTEIWTQEKRSGNLNLQIYLVRLD